MIEREDKRQKERDGNFLSERNAKRKIETERETETENTISLSSTTQA